MVTIPFAEWRPDMPELSEWAREALNVVPAAESYRPLNSLAGVSNALGARAQGAAWFRGTAGGTKMVAGDSGKLYLLTNATWNDASRIAGGPYLVAADGAWRFTQFGSLAVATNGVDGPQKLDLAGGTNFEVLAGAPSGAFTAVVAENFLVFARIGDFRQRTQWSAFNDPESWGSSPTTQADFQDHPDGGEITGLAGGAVGRVFQETAIRRMSYQGPDVIFRFDKVATDLGCSVAGSLASLIGMDFFLHKSGFYVIADGQTVTPIGRDKVDRMFWADFDETNQFRCSSAIDPVRGLYFFAYPSKESSGGSPNRLLIYNWVAQRWAHAGISCELIFGGVSQQSYTLEQLDPFGNLDTLPYSLDSSYWSGVLSLLLFAFDAGNRSGSFSGPALEATIETTDFNPGRGQRSVIRGCRPLIDGNGTQIRIGGRETLQTPVAFGPAVGLTPAGMAPLYTTGRYFRVRATMPAASAWSNAQGIDDLILGPAGQQ